MVISSSVVEVQGSNLSSGDLKRKGLVEDSTSIVRHVETCSAAILGGVTQRNEAREISTDLNAVFWFSEPKSLLVIGSNKLATVLILKVREVIFGKIYSHFVVRSQPKPIFDLKLKFDLG